MGTLALLLFSSPIQHRGPETAVTIAEAAAAEGHSVSVYLLADGVYCTSRALLDAPEPTVVHRFRALPRSVELVNCVTCARFRGLGDGALLENARNGTLEDLVERITSADAFLAFTGES